MVFEPASGWKQTHSIQHPTLKLLVSADPSDYEAINHPAPKIVPCDVCVVTDTGAQSCLWGLSDFLRCGFKQTDLIPVKHTLYAANKEKIEISGAILIRLSGTDDHGELRTAAIMAYVSPRTQRFYLSEEALVQLRVIPRDFPRIGSASENCVIAETEQSETPLAPCGCPKRTLPPSRPEQLPFDCTEENVPKMRNWLLERYSSSTFNQCRHQQLPGITGPSIRLHVKPEAPPSAVHTPSSVPLHWQDEVKAQLDADIALGVIEKVPVGEPSEWCHRMVLARRGDGKPRRTVDLSPLNAHCLRETHHVQPPFQQARTCLLYTSPSPRDPKTSRMPSSA